MEANDEGIFPFQTSDDKFDALFHLCKASEFLPELHSACTVLCKEECRKAIQTLPKSNTNTAWLLAHTRTQYLLATLLITQLYNDQDSPCEHMSLNDCLSKTAELKQLSISHASEPNLLRRLPKYLYDIFHAFESFYIIPEKMIRSLKAIQFLILLAPDGIWEATLDTILVPAIDALYSINRKMLECVFDITKGHFIQAKQCWCQPICQEFSVSTKEPKLLDCVTFMEKCNESFPEIVADEKTRQRIAKLLTTDIYSGPYLLPYNDMFSMLYHPTNAQ